MATAEELLAAETGTNKVLTIDSDLRTITIPAGFGVFGVESDDDVLRVHFRGPRYYHDVDLSTFEVKVNINNAKGEEDAYPVDDVTVDNVSDTITFSWLVGRFTAQYRGDIKFSLCFRKINSEGIVTREFNTTTATGKILEGLETGEAIVQAYPDVIGGILLRLESLEENGIPAASLDTTLTVEGKAADAKAVGDALGKLTQNMVVTIDPETSTASHTSTAIIEHLNAGGDAVLKTWNDGYASLYGIVSDTVWFSGVNVFEDRTVQYTYVVDPDGAYTMTETTMEAGTDSGTNAGMTEEQAEQLQANTDAIAELNNPVVSGTLTIETQKYTMTLTLEDGFTETHILETDENDYPVKLTVNGNEIPWTTTVAEV